MPEDFYAHEIKFYNFGWRDHHTTDNNMILKILKNMDLCLKNGNKVAVHCHAGRGRTGLIICAYLIYSQNYTAEKAIKLFKEKRSPGLDKKSQRKTLYDFERCEFYSQLELFLTY